MADSMDTLVDRMQQLQAAGWVAQFSVSEGAVRCDECGCSASPEEATVDEVFRFEGESDPADESILFAMTMPCEHRGALPATYGKDTAPEIGDVLTRLRLRRD